MSQNELKEKLLNSYRKNFDEVDIDDLEDITKINFSKKSDEKEKLLDFIKTSKNPYMFRLGEKKIKIEFSNTENIASECLTKAVANIYK